MKKRLIERIFTALFIFMAVCLIATMANAQENTDKGAAEEKTSTADGRTMDSEAQAALQEASRLYETNPEDLAAVREPLIQYLASPPEDRLTPDNLYQMLAQFWYVDETIEIEKRMEEARKIYKLGYEAFPKDDSLLLNYAVTTYQLANELDNTEAANKLFMAAAGLFEKYYELNENHEIKYLEYAAAAYYTALDLENAKRVYTQMIGLQRPESRWLDSLIYICQEQENSTEEEKYIRLALEPDNYPMEKKYWKLLANLCLDKAVKTDKNEYYLEAAAAFEIATRVEVPDQKTEWRTLIDLYNFLSLPLRSADSIQEGLDLLAKESTEEEQQLAIAEAYDRGARVDKAVSFLDSCIAKNPSYELKLKKATILYDARRNEEALAALDDCIAAKSNAYDAYYMKGWIAWDMENWEMAKEAFGKAANSREEAIRYTAENALDMMDSLEKAKSE